MELFFIKNSQKLWIFEKVEKPSNKSATILKRRPWLFTEIWKSKIRNCRLRSIQLRITTFFGTNVSKFEFETFSKNFFPWSSIRLHCSRPCNVTNEGAHIQDGSRRIFRFLRNFVYFYELANHLFIALRLLSCRHLNSQPASDHQQGKERNSVKSRRKKRLCRQKH